MTLKAVVENLDDVPEALRGEYAEKDGKFYLDLDDTIKAHQAVLPLANALKAVKTEKTALQTKLSEAMAKAAPEGFDTEEWNRLKELDEKMKKDPNYKGPTDPEAQQRLKDQYEQRLANLEKKRIDDLAEKDKVISSRDEVLRRRVVEDDLTQALTAASIAPKFVKAVRAMLKSVVKTEREEESGEFVAHVETDLGSVSVMQYVESWAKSDEGKSFVEPPRGGGAQGADKGGRGEVNPFSRDNWSVTSQGAMVKDKGFEHATKMAKLAGTTVGGPMPERRPAA